MATNLALDDKLVIEACRLGKHRTKRDAVNAALREYVQRKGQLAILNLEGSIEYDPKYDYKAARKRR